MKITWPLAIILIAVPLLALVISSWSAGMVNYVQVDVRALAAQRMVQYPFLCENSIQEAGYARIALGVLGLLILYYPFRSKQWWGWVSIAILFLYNLRIFVLPPGTSFRGWQDLRELFVRPELPRMMLLNFVFPGLLLIGLAISLPAFVSRRRKLVP